MLIVDVAECEPPELLIVVCGADPMLIVEVPICDVVAVDVGAIELVEFVCGGDFTSAVFVEGVFAVAPV